MSANFGLDSVFCSTEDIMGLMDKVDGIHML
jgi:hypothetical protein